VQVALQVEPSIQIAGKVPDLNGRQMVEAMYCAVDVLKDFPIVWVAVNNGLKCNIDKIMKMYDYEVFVTIA